MERQRSWAVGILLIALMRQIGAGGGAIGTFCTLDEMAPSPPVCGPLEHCDMAPVAEYYAKVTDTCRARAVTRSAERTRFLRQVNNWYGDIPFFVGRLTAAHREKHAVAFELEQRLGRSEPLVDELEWKHLVYSAEAGRTHDALLTFLTAGERRVKVDEMVAAFGTNPNFNEVVLESVLHFVRSIPEQGLRVEFYKALRPLVLKRNLNSTYAALLYGADVHSSMAASPGLKTHYNDVTGAMVARYKAYILAPKYPELAWFERRFPSYFAFYLEQFTSFTEDEWIGRLGLRRFYEFVNELTDFGNRFALFERILELSVRYDKGKVVPRTKDSRLLALMPTLANEVARFQEALEKAGQKPDHMKRLEALKRRFSIQPRQDYKFYLERFKTHGKYGYKASLAEAHNSRSDANTERSENIVVTYERREI